MGQFLDYTERTSYDTNDSYIGIDESGNVINIPSSVLKTYFETLFPTLSGNNEFEGTQVFNDDVSFYDDNGVLIMKYDATARTFIWSGALGSAEGYVRLNGNFPLYLSTDEADFRFGTPSSYVTFETKLAAKAALNGASTEDFDADSLEATDMTYAKSGTPNTPAETGLFVHEETDGNTVISLGSFSGLYTVMFGTSIATSGYGIAKEEMVVDIDNDSITSASSVRPAGYSTNVSVGGSDPGSTKYWFYIDTGALKLRTPTGVATSGINIKINPTYYTF